MGHQTTDGTMDNPQSINALAAAGVSKMRKTIWANKMDHLLIVIRDGKPTIWSYLFCPMNKSLSGRDPLPLCAIEMDFDKAEWLPYTGPDAESAEYRAERDRCTELMSSSGNFRGAGTEEKTKGEDVCKGAWELGTACGTCSKCLATKPDDKKPQTCQGVGCGAAPGQPHSAECHAEHEAATSDVLTGRYRRMRDAPKDGTAILALLDGSDIQLPIRWRGQGDTMAKKGPGWYVTWDNYALQPADGPRGWLPIPTEWLPEAEPQWQQYAQKAHDVDGHCDVVLVADLKRASAPSAAPAGIEDPVTVPRGLLGAACAAIDRKHDAPKTLAALRRYTVGDLSATTPNQSVSAQLLHALTLLLSYTKACEGLLNCKPAGQIEIAEKAIEAASRGGSY